MSGAPSRVRPVTNPVQEIEIRWTNADDPIARPLVDDLAREYDRRYESHTGAHATRELSRYPAELFSEEYGGAFAVLLVDGVLAAGGAFKRADPETAEIRRVWTHPQFRRTGLSRRVMAALEAEAALRGYEAIELMTGARQPEAVALYLSLGYTPLFDIAGDFERINFLRFTKPLTSQKTSVAPAP